MVLGFATASDLGLRGALALPCMSTDTDVGLEGRGRGGRGGMALGGPGAEDTIEDVLRGGRARDGGRELALALA